ncbi:MAG: hypothetical protein ISS71_08280 [Phycisphaerae bacterium]|nr:hypothetical protein [Phycisphaerae bacterium]
MSIRREDKEMIHHLALLGSLLGACLGVFAIVHLSGRAYEQNRQYSEYQQTHAALAKLSSPKGVPGELVVDQTIIKQMQEQMQAEQPEAIDTQQSFWLRIPRWGFWGICGVSGLLGAVAGFSTIWLTGWVGSLFVYCFIRTIYKVIRKVAPNSAAAKPIPIPQNQSTGAGLLAFQRNDNRLLPILVKLLFLLLLVLSVLGVVVWHLAGM